MKLAKLLIGQRPGSETAVTAGAHTTIGRGPGNDVRVEDAKVSRRHAVLRREADGAYVLTDLGSMNGTYLNGRRVLVPERLRDGDRIQVGAETIVYSNPDAGARRTDESHDQDVTTTVVSGSNEATVLGTSPAMQVVFGLMRKAATSTIPVLISGETGTGKEVAARAIHHVSARSDKPFVAVNCAALPETLLEAELFGHRHGSFTGATDDRAGLFEAADGGTVFLDEIGEMALATQPKLLRVLQEGEVTRIGETRPRAVDVRLVSATNRDLEASVESHGFRADLYYRLAAFPIVLPPLRDRRPDIALLAEHFLALANRRHGKRIAGIHADAYEVLMTFEWPGNVRQLQNEIQRAVVLIDDGDWIRPEHLTIAGRREDAGDADAPAPPPPGAVANLADARASFEARHIARVLEEQGGNVSRAASVLGVSRVGLHRKLKEFGLR